MRATSPSLTDASLSVTEIRNVRRRLNNTSDETSSSVANSATRIRFVYPRDPFATGIADFTASRAINSLASSLSVTATAETGADPTANPKASRVPTIARGVRP